VAIPGQVLETDRLFLRPFDLDDLDDLAAILGDPETMRFYKRPFTHAEAQAWIENNLRRYAGDGFGLWAMLLKDTGELAGNCGPALRIVDGTEEVEVGWIVKRSLWGRGLATEAGRASCAFVFDNLDRERVISLIRPVNLPSRRVAEKIGMSAEKETMYAEFPHLVYTLRRREARSTG
jgi:ribosomal-protein-alanine N-acetyltransferase